MKLSVSNIAWGKENLPEFLTLLKNNGCDGIELAPSIIWKEPTEISSEEKKKFKKTLRDHDVELVGFHSLLYSKPELELFKNNKAREQTIQYIFSLIDLCNSLGGKKLIFGSPRNRRLNGKKYLTCFKQAVEDFKNIARYCKKQKIYFCIEALSENISEFIKTIGEGVELVEFVNEPYFKLHIDTKTLFYTNEDLDKILKNKISLIEHVHVSDDNLNPPGTINKNHEYIANILKKNNYKKFISIEMRKNNEINKEENKKVIRESINFVKNIYC